ncbi:MAG TPA: alpha/beta hydrolase [Propionibacterium sp.]|nr:alpha/beta hydrolase [Propionibacterium sp.]
MSPDLPTRAEIAARRAENAAGKAALGPGPSLQRHRTLSIPTPDNVSVRARLLVPTASPRGVLVYLHGGGWVLGSIDTFDRLGRELARRSGWAVLMVDYAKAPERRFPDAVEDAWAALQWVPEHAGAELVDLLTPPAEGWRIAVGGDSAGGNLAAVAALRARDAGLLLDGQLLIYPVTDSDLDRPSYRSDPASRARLDEFWSLYCRDEQRTDPDAVPLRASSLAGTAPALVVNAEFDALNDEVDLYASRLAAEGVPVERHTMAGLHHGSISHWGTAPAASEALFVVAAWLNRAR